MENKAGSQRAHINKQKAKAAIADRQEVLIEEQELTREEKKAARWNSHEKEVKASLAKILADKTLACNSPKWKKIGRPRKYETPVHLWMAACEYFEYNDTNPLEKNEAVKSGDMAGMIIAVPVRRPYTKVGLASFMGMTADYVKELKTNKEFSPVMELIDSVIETQQVEAAIAGLANPLIVSRLLGLTDKMEIDQRGELKATFQLNVVNPGIPLAGSESEVDLISIDD